MRYVFVLIGMVVCLMGGIDKVNAGTYGNFNTAVVLDLSQVESP